MAILPSHNFICHYIKQHSTKSTSTINFLKPNHIYPSQNDFSNIALIKAPFLIVIQLQLYFIFTNFSLFESYWNLTHFTRFEIGKTHRSELV